MIFQANKYGSRPKLRNTIIAGVQKFPFPYVPQFRKVVDELVAIISENGVKQPPDILEHDGARATFINNPNSLREKITFIGMTKLLACSGERRTWNSTGKKIYAAKVMRSEIMHIALADIPFWPVRSKGFASRSVDFDKTLMRKTCHLEPKRLPSCTRTKLN